MSRLRRGHRVQDLSFEAAAGEIVGLIGPNGAGKTTTLRCLAGILGRLPAASSSVATIWPLPDRGQEAAGVHAGRAPPVRIHDRPGASRLVGRLYGLADIDARARPLLEELELRGKEQLLPGELSRGMRQKVVIACGLVRDPPLLLFDEPLTGLDPIGIRRMRDTIVRRARDGAAVLLSSHLLPLVRRFARAS